MQRCNNRWFSQIFLVSNTCAFYLCRFSQVFATHKGVSCAQSSWIVLVVQLSERYLTASSARQVTSYHNNLTARAMQLALVMSFVDSRHLKTYTSNNKFWVWEAKLENSPTFYQPMLFNILFFPAVSPFLQVIPLRPANSRHSRARIISWLYLCPHFSPDFVEISQWKSHDLGVGPRGRCWISWMQN